MKKAQIKKAIIIIFMLFCLIVLCYSGFKIIAWYLNNKENAKVAQETKEYITITKDKKAVDFEALKKKNPDTVAYLKVKNTNIDYVVVKSTNNTYYLNHNFNQEYNPSGWIFADYRNKFDNTDKNIIIYGHNTMDGSMFGSLKNVLKQEWDSNEKNLDITLVTEKGEIIYEVFSVYQIKAEDYYIQTDFQNNDFSKFLDTIKSRSIYDFKTDVNENNIILTLSTCSSTGKERVVLHAKH